MRRTGVLRLGLVLTLVPFLLALPATGALKPPQHSHLAGAAAAVALDDDDGLQLLTSAAASPEARLVLALGLSFMLGSALLSPGTGRAREPRRSRAPPSG